MNKLLLIFSGIFAIALTVYNIALFSTPETDMASNSNRKINSPEGKTFSHALVTGKRNMMLEKKVTLLQHEIAATNTALKNLATRFDALAQSTNNTALMDETYEPSQVELEEQKIAEQKIQEQNNQRFNEQLLALEDDFTSESLDNNWAEQKTGSVMAALESMPAETQDGIVLKATECRSSMCRIEVEYADEISQTEFEMHLPMVVGEDFPKLSVRHENQQGFIKGIYFLQSEDS